MDGGPPGTGKSQTITNIIAQLLAAGRTVLFVSEKAAALDVVKKRLDEAGLGNYVLELHSAKATRKEVARTLGQVIAERPIAPKGPSASDLNQLAKDRMQLSAYAAAQNEIRHPFGQSLHWILGRCRQLDYAPATQLPESIDQTLSSEMFAEIMEQARRLSLAWGPVERGDEFLWRDLADPREAQRRAISIEIEVGEISSALATARGVLDSASATLLLDPVRNEGAAADLVCGINLLVDRRPIPVGWLTATNLDEVGVAARGRHSLFVKMRKGTAELQARVGPQWEGFPPQYSTELEGVIAGLAGMKPSFQSIQLSIPAVVEIQLLVSAWSSSAEKILTEAGTLASEMGVSMHEPTLGQVQAIAQVASLRATPSLPEPTWLTAEGLASVKHAVALLQPAVVRQRSLWQQLSTVFTADVTRLDVESIFDGPQDDVPKLSKWNSRGRANRQRLAACCSEGR